MDKNQPNPAQQASDANNPTKYCSDERPCTPCFSDSGRCEDAPPNKHDEIGHSADEFAYVTADTRAPAARELTAAQGVGDSEVLAALRNHVESNFPTQAAYALSLHVSPSYVSDVLNGRREIPADWVFSLGYRKSGWEKIDPALSQPIEPQDAVVGECEVCRIFGDSNLLRKSATTVAAIDDEMVVRALEALSPEAVTNRYGYRKGYRVRDIIALDDYEATELMRAALEAALPVAVGAGEDAELLDSGMIVIAGRDEFGEPTRCLHTGMNLRAQIQEAIDYQAATPAGKGSP